MSVNPRRVAGRRAGYGDAHRLVQITVIGGARFLHESCLLDSGKNRCGYLQVPTRTATANDFRAIAACLYREGKRLSQRIAARLPPPQRARQPLPLCLLDAALLIVAIASSAA